MTTHINLGDYAEEYPRTYIPLDPEKGARDRFEHAWQTVKPCLHYQRSWSDGYGCHTTAVLQPEIRLLQPGEIRRSTTPGGRRMIIIGTLHGPVVVFERFMPKDKRGQIYICNTTKAVIELFNAHFEKDGLDGPLSAHTMLALLGEDPLTENIGHTLDFVAHA